MGNLYAKLSVDTFCDDRIAGLSNSGAVVVWLAGMTYAQRHETDGIVTLKQLQRELFMCSFIGDLNKIEVRANELVDVQLWRSLEHQKYFICGWFDWNRSKVEIEEIRARRRQGGKKGGRPAKNVEPVTPRNLEGFTLSNPETETETETYKDIVQLQKVERVQVSAEILATFYGPYPRHQGKGAVPNALGKALMRVTLEDIMLGVKRYLASAPHSGCDHGIKKCFVPLPATWLNQSRWEDEYPMATGTAAPTGPPTVTRERIDEAWKEVQDGPKIRFEEPLLSLALVHLGGWDAFAVGDDDERYERLATAMRAVANLPVTQAG